MMLFSFWYLQAMVAREKHVVIIIDNSGSMKEIYDDSVGKSLVSNSAKALIGALNSYDKVRYSTLFFSKYLLFISCVKECQKVFVDLRLY